MGRRTVIAGAVVVGVLLFAAAAEAGEYHVYSCRTPSGEPAPADGWVGSVAPGGAYDDYTLNDCANGGSLVAALGDQTTHLAYVDRATWAFDTPPFATLRNVTLWRSGYVAGTGSEEASYEFWLSAPLIKDVLDECVYSTGCRSQGSERELAGDAVQVPSAALGENVFLSVSCGAGAEDSECPAGQGDADNYAAALYLYAADLTLEQVAGPSVANVGGELASTSTLAGTEDVTFDASDPGSGVYEAVFTVDGSVVQSDVLDEAGGRCRNVGETSDGLPAFLYLQPCPASISADVGFESTRVANGVHHLLVSVVDAAGNSAPVLDRVVTVANPGAPGPPNGSGATADAHLSLRWSSTARARLTTSFGRRETILGQLTGEHGAPIAGAELQLSALPSVAGAATVAMPIVRTDAAGGFQLRLAAGLSSRTLTFSYAARIGEARPAVARSLELAVRAPVSLTIAPRAVDAGGTIHFRGHLGAGPVPAGGKPVILEARSEGGAWIEFDVLRTDARGRFHATYTFRFPGPVTYQFRVLCEQEADYPYAAGASPAVSVYEH
jgi:hypothetical protein